MLVFITSLDLLFADPNYALHPVRLMGKLIEWFETKTTFLSRTGPRKMMGSWQARHFVQNFDADLVGWV